MDTNVTITGDRAIALRLEKFPDRLHERLVSGITGLTARLLDRVRAAEPRRTGRLVSETVSFIDETPDLVRGRVKVSAPGEKGEHGKAAALEYGTHGSTKVKPHPMTLSHFWARAVAPRQVLVQAYTRSPNITADHYLRGALAGMEGEIRTELQKALDEAAAA